MGSSGKFSMGQPSTLNITQAFLPAVRPFSLLRQEEPTLEAFRIGHPNAGDEAELLRNWRMHCANMATIRVDDERRELHVYPARNGGNGNDFPAWQWTWHLARGWAVNARTVYTAPETFARHDMVDDTTSVYAEGDPTTMRKVQTFRIAPASWLVLLYRLYGITVGEWQLHIHPAALAAPAPRLVAFGDKAA
jgi:hypothetical protein